MVVVVPEGVDADAGVPGGDGRGSKAVSDTRLGCLRSVVAHSACG